MLPIHAALWALTGSPEMSACHTLSEGNTGHDPAPGTELAPAGAPPIGPRAATTANPSELAATTHRFGA